MSSAAILLGSLRVINYCTSFVKLYFWKLAWHCNCIYKSLKLKWNGSHCCRVNDDKTKCFKYYIISSTKWPLLYMPSVSLLSVKWTNSTKTGFRPPNLSFIAVFKMPFFLPLKHNAQGNMVDSSMSLTFSPLRKRHVKICAKSCYWCSPCTFHTLMTLDVNI